MKKANKDELRLMRQRAYMGFMKRQKHSQDQLMLETTSIKDLKKK